MPNIASVFKAEITRLARKEVREDSDHLKKVVAAHRTEIASLKRRVQALEALVKRLARGRGADSVRAARAAPVEPGRPSTEGLRFRAKGMAANRQRLGLSASDFGLLVGTTGQSVYAWEAGKTKPKPDSLAAIAALRGIGKREVEARLASLKSA
jgi:DNA-binding XRE family transcriptional regulator